MKLETKRIYIDNLYKNITNADLEQKFSEYGNVTSVEIKNRKNVESKSASQFAYVTLIISKNDLTNCFEEFADKKWKGQWISLQEAKESFMERLKRERAEHVTANTIQTFASSHTEPSISYVNNINKYTQVYHSSSSDEENTLKQDINDRRHRQKSKLSNTTHHVKIHPYSSKLNKSICKDFKDTEVLNDKLANSSEADKKRVQSIIRMRKNYQEQKQALKSALANIDSKPKNKIIFDEDSEVETLPTMETQISTKISKVQENRVDLFEEDDEAEHEEYNFEIKGQFEGKKGQKLMQLQSKFKNDKRFMMDERFLEDEKYDDMDKEESIEASEMTLDEEQQKQFEILEQVIGKKIKPKSFEKDAKHVRQNLKMMLRFDPAQPNHSKFEIKDEKRKKHGKREDKPSPKLTNEVPKPEVSKETFYKVAVNLKDALQEKEKFSLANLFNKTIETVESENAEENMVKQKPKNLSQHEPPNPFHYDSSADEDTAPIKTDEKLIAAQTLNYNKVGTAKLWTESFFFKHDDYRLQEGLDFIKRLEVDDQSDFPKLRRNLHEIVKAKVRNNQRKNRPFRKKLGGKKRLRIKRAMKR